MKRPKGLVAAFLLAGALGVGAAMIDDDTPGDPGEHCFQPKVLPISGTPSLNGLPVIQQSLEIVGEHVKVVVETTNGCSKVTPSALPFEWQITGPSGPVTPEDGGSLRPYFRPLVAGAYQARITYCPQTCLNKQVASDVLDIPPQTASVAIIVVNQMPVPPSTHPQLTPTALATPTPAQFDEENQHHLLRGWKCAFPNDLSDASTPQLVPVRPWSSQADYQLLEGRIPVTRIAYNDNELNHYSHDIGIHVVPDPRHRHLKMPEKADMDVEWESNYLPASMRPSAGDRISAFGFHTYDCHHSPIVTEIHPPVLTAVHRSRAVRVPDGFAPPGGDPLGANIWVPGIITDIWANVRAGEISSNCSSTGLHQEAVLPTIPAVYGACIQSPHPIRRSYTFNIYLPENPQARVARAGLVAPPAPLHVRVEPGAGPAPAVVRDDTDGGVPVLRVTVDLTGYTGQTYDRRIVAAWVQPSPANWGLEQWKVGIPSMQVFQDHDTGSDGDWVFWAAINNRDQEWTRLLNGDSVDTGHYTFDNRPWETGSPDADRSLGPHLLLFNPPFGHHFPRPTQDLTQSLELHTSGYDEEFWDDEVGMVQKIFQPNGVPVAIGERITATQTSSTSDYRLTYFYERVGPIAGANLTAAGHSLAAAYTLGANGRCTSIRRNLCVVLPDTAVGGAWDPSQEPTSPGGPEINWNAHAVFKPQEPEPFSLTEMPLDHLGRAVSTMVQRAPARARKLFEELREEFDEVRGTAMESEYARALPAFEPHLPADQWQLHFGDIDPTPVDLTVTRISMSPPGAAAGERVVFAVEIANRGLGAAAPFAARMEIGGTELRTLSVSGLAPDATTMVDFPAWTAVAGEHHLRASADALSQIAEPAEDDNTLERRFIVGQAPRGLADLLVLSMRFEPYLPRAGQAVTFIARVQNTGGNVLDGLVVRFVVDSKHVGDVTVAGLPSGQVVEVRSPAWTAVRRRHTLQVTVDAPAAVPEQDETNNTLTRVFAVRGRAGRGGAGSLSQ